VADGYRLATATPPPSAVSSGWLALQAGKRAAGRPGGWGGKIEAEVARSSVTDPRFVFYYPGHEYFCYRWDFRCHSRVGGALIGRARASNFAGMVAAGFGMSEFYPAEARRAKDDPFRRRNVPAHALTALPPKFAAVIDLMIYGATEAVTIEGAAVAAGMPLTLRQAARHAGVRLRAARAVSDTALFQGAFSKALLALRRAEGRKTYTPQSVSETTRAITQPQPKPSGSRRSTALRANPARARMCRSMSPSKPI
jgi:hypothetical protein